MDEQAVVETDKDWHVYGAEIVVFVHHTDDLAEEHAYECTFTVARGDLGAFVPGQEMGLRVVELWMQGTPAVAHDVSPERHWEIEKLARPCAENVCDDWNAYGDRSAA